jgi:hypothetical protein
MGDDINFSPSGDNLIVRRFLLFQPPFVLAREMNPLVQQIIFHFHFDQQPPRYQGKILLRTSRDPDVSAPYDSYREVPLRAYMTVCKKIEDQ